MTIAELEINIRDNAKTSSTSLKEFANDLREVKSASTEAKGGLEGLANVNPNVNNLRNQVSRLNTALKPLASTLKQIQEGLEALGHRGMKSALRESVQNTSQLQGKVTEATKGTVGTDTSLSDKAAIAIGQSTVATDTSIKEATKDTEKLVEKTKEAKKESLDLGKALKGLHITKLLGQFGRLLKMKILRTIVSNLLKGFTEGLENAYNWASLTGNAFKASMDKISTSLNYAKNSIGAMVAPLVNMLAPVLDWIVDKFVAVINIINEFFALLGGQATYIRALKTPITWGEDATQAIGGAAGAAKDLKDALDVLPFDELNQLSAPSDSGSGGGGGGGSAGSADYGSMFEEVEISKATRFLRDNFEEIAALVASIGTGILAWKFSNTFLTGLNTLQKASITVSVAGFTIEGIAAYDMGKNGFTLKKLIEGALGAGLGIAGLTVSFGGAGLVLGLSAAVLVGITGFILGEKAAIKEKLSQTEWWQDLLLSIDTAKTSIQSANNAWAKSDQLAVEYAQNMSKIKVAQSLLDDIDKLKDKTSLTNEETLLLRGKIDALNNLGLDGISLTFDTLTGTVSGDIDAMKTKLDELQAKLTETYYSQILSEALTNQSQAKVEQQIAQNEIDRLKTDNAELLEWFASERSSGGGWAINSGMTRDEWNERVMMAEEVLEAIQENETALASWESVGATADARVNAITQALKNLGIEIPGVTDGMDGFSSSAELSSNIAKSLWQILATGNQNLINLASGYVKAAIGEEKYNAATEKAQTATNFAKNAVDTFKEKLQNLTNLDYGQMNTNLQNGIKEVDGTKAGNTIKNEIESGINKTGTNLDYVAIKDLIDTKLKGQKWAPTGKGIGELIGKALNTGLSISEIYNACYSRLGVVFNDSGWANLGWGVGKAIGGGITDAIAQLINAYTMKVSYTVNGQSKTETVYTEAWWIERYGAYANGGFPKAGSLFIAGEEMGNTEFLGNINGKTAVAPQDDIVTAVQRGVVQALGNRGSETTQVNVYMDSQKVASAVAKGNRMMNRRLNVSVS